MCLYADTHLASSTQMLEDCGDLKKVLARPQNTSVAFHHLEKYDLLFVNLQTRTGLGLGFEKLHFYFKSIVVSVSFN